MEYWDNKGKVYNDKLQKLTPQEKAYNFLLKNFGDVKNEDVIMGAISMAAPFTKVKYLPQVISAARLLYHKPFEKMSPEEYKNYGKLGKEYYKKYIQGNKVYNPEVQKKDYKQREGIMFTGGQAGEPDYRYMEQYPKLEENIEKSLNNYFEETRPKIGKDGKLYMRNDAKGFSNLKVDWKGQDYDYQIRHNPFLEMPDFYNIQPYDVFINKIKNGTP